MNARNESKPPEDDDSEDTTVLMAETPIPPILKPTKTKRTSVRFVRFL